MIESAAPPMPIRIASHTVGHPWSDTSYGPTRELRAGRANASSRRSHRDLLWDSPQEVADRPRRPASLQHPADAMDLLRSVPVTALLSDWPKPSERRLPG